MSQERARCGSNVTGWGRRSDPRERPQMATWREHAGARPAGQDEVEANIKRDQVAAQQRKADMIKLADAFQSAAREIIETVSSASTELEASASTLTSTAERSQELATMVAAASEEAST